MGFLDRFLGKGTDDTTGRPQPAKVPSVAKSPAPKAPSSSSGTNLPAHRVVRRSLRPMVASSEQISALLGKGVSVLSGKNGVFELPTSQQVYVALVERDQARILLVAKDHTAHADASSARSLLERKKAKWERILLVELDVIRRLYERHEQSTTSALVPGDTAQMQREFIALLDRAARRGSSDIHIIVKRYEAVVKIRADGVMMKLQDLTSAFATDLCQAAFAMADASDPTYTPNDYQGARINESNLGKLKLPEGVQSVRLQFNPLPANGRYMVARLLYSQKIGTDADVDELGYAPNQIRQIRDMRRKPFGINVISGPTGSGKSTTLQRGLTALMKERPGINVVTIEDPPEYTIDGAAQLPVVNAKTADERSEKFRQAITASLRSDPDVIMIGEIRDGASAQLAFEAAMTGHGVWASLHANDAISILDRLRDQKIESYKLFDASLVTGLIGQRLVRRTSAEHSVPFEEGVAEGYLDEEVADLLRERAGQWLDRVHFAGTSRFDPSESYQAYQGRSVVAEVLLPDQKFLDLMKADKKVEARRYWLEELSGMTMLEHAFYLVCCGRLDPREMEEKVGLIRDLDVARVERVIELAGGIA